MSQSFHTIPRDKLLHHAAGTWAALAGVCIAVWAGLPGYFGALEAALVVGLGREIYNVLAGGKWSTADVGWTVLGAVPVAAVSFIGA
jgi:hypothetical protein